MSTPQSHHEAGVARLSALLAVDLAELKRRFKATVDQRYAFAQEKLEAAGMDLNIAAPYPKSTLGRATYRQQLRFREMLQLFSKPAWTSRKMGEPFTMVMNPDSLVPQYAQAEATAQANFDAYVAKLVAKIARPIVDASVSGSLWQNSILTVRLEDGTEERWKTKIILNHSCLGKLFNQFPTRKMK